MNFPEEKDIQRIIKMAGMDEGFFCLAVYSFMERYMVDYIKEAGKFPINNKDCKYRELIVKFWGSKFNHQIETRFNKNGFPYIWPVTKDSTFDTLLRFCDGKGNADEIRHTFAFGKLDQLQVAISDLFNFLRLSEENKALEELKLLQGYLKNWDERKNTDELKKQIDELNKRILKFVDLNGKNIKTIKELEEARSEYEKRISELENKIDFNDSITQEIEKIRHENDLLLEYVENLRQLTSYTKTRNEYEQNVLRLSFDQIQCVENYSDEAFYLITGTAGTGKSLILLKLIQKIIEKSKTNNSNVPNYVLVTYTNTLAKYNKFTSELLDKSISENIQTVDTLISDVFSSSYFNTLHFAANRYNDDFEDTKAFLKKYFPQADVYYRLDAAKELTNNILPNALSKEDYLSDETVNSTKTDKEIIWGFADACFNLYETEKLDDIPYILACYILSKKLQEYPSIRYNYIFVDEAQDLSVAKLLCLKNMTSHLILTGDDNQMIYSHGRSIKLFLSDNNKSFHLSTNFRNTIQINDFSERYRLSGKVEQPLVPETNGFRNGPEVEVYEFETKAVNYLPEHLKAIKAKVDLYIDELGYSPDNIVILISKKAENLQSELKEVGLETDVIKQMEDFTPTGKVKVSTIHSAKGLSFPVVLFMTGENDITENNNDAFIEMRHSLYYIAMTRAMDILNIFTLSSNRECKYISDIFKAYQKNS